VAAGCKQKQPAVSISGGWSTGGEYCRIQRSALQWGVPVDLPSTCCAKEHKGMPPPNTQYINMQAWVPAPSKASHRSVRCHTLAMEEVMYDGRTRTKAGLSGPCSGRAMPSRISWVAAARLSTKAAPPATSRLRKSARMVGDADDAVMEPPWAVGGSGQNTDQAAKQPRPPSPSTQRFWIAVANVRSTLEAAGDVIRLPKQCAVQSGSGWPGRLSCTNETCTSGRPGNACR